MRKVFITILLLTISFVSARAQANNDTVMILPFENTSDKAEFNWVGESFADGLASLMSSNKVKATRLNVISNDERKVVQQRLKIPLTTLPSLATSLKIAREANATLLVIGNFSIVMNEVEKDKIIPTVYARAKIINVRSGAFVVETDEKGVPFYNKDGRIDLKEIDSIKVLTDLPSIQGEIAYKILFLRDKNTLPFSLNEINELANKVPSRAFEAFIKGLITSETQTRENYFKNAMRIYSDDEKTKGSVYTDAALELGHLSFTQGKNTEAIDYFGRVINAVLECKERAKSENKYLQCKDESYAEASFYSSLVQWQQKNYEQSLAVLRPLEEDLKLTSVYSTLGAIALQASIAERKNKGKSDGFLKEGLEHLKKAFDSSPDEPNVRFNYGLALFLNNNFKEAAEQLRPAIVVNPRDGESYFLLAKALESIKDQTAADVDNQARQNLTAENKYAVLQKEWLASNTVSNINVRLQQPLRKDFVSVILIKKQAAPLEKPLNETESLLEQARTLYKAGNDDEAMTVLRKILASEPMSAEAYLLLGNIHLRRGDLEQSVSSLKTALFWDNRLINAHIGLGKIYLQRGDCLQAKTYAGSALAIDSENQDALGLQRQVERCSK